MKREERSEEDIETTTTGGEKFCLGFMEATTESALMGQVYYPIT